jgi:Zn finger protein HypA/HybF involved in hydrogenase expression
MDWKCNRCDFELVEVKKESLSDIKDTFNFFGINKDWESVESEWIKICPNCNSHALGLSSDHHIPIRTKSVDITTLHDLPYVKAHDHSEYQTEILKSDICGCFRCLKTFTPDQIDQWHGELALCPMCGIDSVIGSASGFPIEKEFLSKMHDFWFSPSGFSKAYK